MKSRNMWFGYMASIAQCKLSERIHNMCDIDSVWTTGGTGLTGSAYPDRITGEYFIFQPEMH